MGTTLVAGGTGSLGTALVTDLAARGESVVVMAQPGSAVNPQVASLDVEIRRADIRDPDAVRAAVRKADLAYNVAGISVPLNSLHRPMVGVNVQGARIFAECCAQEGVERLVHVSSISAVGYPPPGEIADETFEFAHSVCTNSYALTKRGGEEAVRQVIARTGLDATIIVPAAVVAPWSDLKTGWAALVRLAASGRLLAYPMGGISLCSLTGFLSGARGIMDRGEPGERYIVTTTNTTYRDFFDIVCAVVDRPPPRIAVAPSLLRRGSRAIRAVTPPRARTPLIARENVDLMNAHLSYDSTRARTELGFEPGDVRDSIITVRDWLEGGAR